MITSFTGVHAFLSNFHPSLVTVGGVEWPTAEHAYQMFKIEPGSNDATEWINKIVAAPTPAEAKRIGRQLPLWSQWEQRKLGCMEFVLKRKFELPELGARLIGTGNEILVEGNTWHDQYWGDCTCPRHAAIAGQNALGILLMRLRLDLRG